MLVDFNVAGYEARRLHVTTPIYEGPLDLLLHLIERAELDITRLSLAKVTDQYLAHLRGMQESLAGEVTAFLVIATRLIQIKSEALLPRPPTREVGDEDPGEALARQLILYKQFKLAAAHLSDREQKGLHTYLRLAPPPKIEAMLDLEGISLQDLHSIALTIFTQIDERLSLGNVVAPPKITIREKIRLITHSLRSQGRITFFHLLPEYPTPLEVVVTFLAMLELIKRQVVEVHQDNIFGEISITSKEMDDASDEFELEFGE